MDVDRETIELVRELLSAANDEYYDYKEDPDSFDKLLKRAKAWLAAHPLKAYHHPDSEEEIGVDDGGAQCEEGQEHPDTARMKKLAHKQYGHLSDSTLLNLDTIRRKIDSDNDHIGYPIVEHPDTERRG